MKRELSCFKPYWLILLVTYFVLPVFLAGNVVGAVILLCGIQPVVCVFCGVRIGKAHGVVWSCAAVPFVLFLISMFIFYNATAFIYGVIQAGCMLTGCIVASGIWPQPEEDEEEE